ncbi:hypothetical protein MF271_01430 (plasmid) [Deinococcus sp. KNUC1210]|uniref:hypothetical protein n=1 Tax=Deinococcus sp. KNUC1210 TaxID=2917691 RepID=UPI001EF087DF|nr:hypothetical protein [Deinococcus sp. KNUC1210]ULH14214.1 hypothetical protein MF271_01430 [Deinococcus sp. KNUC1210]
MKRSLLALSILSAYSRVNRLTRRLERSQGSQRAALLPTVEEARVRLAQLQDRYAGQEPQTRRSS